jgi:hypothetical protein
VPWIIHLIKNEFTLESYNNMQDTLYDYFYNNLIRKDRMVIDHAVRAELVTLHNRRYIKFYIHPADVSGDTPTFFLAEPRLDGTFDRHPNDNLKTAKEADPTNSARSALPT